MREIEQDVPNWRELVESSSYITNRKGDITDGSQSTVLTRPELGVVIKIPKHSIFLENYISAGEKTPECVVLFQAVDGLNLRLDHRTITIPKVIVQKKVQTLDILLGDVVQRRNSREMEKIVRAAAQIDREMFGNGVVISDPKFANQGLDKDGSVKFTDVGSARTEIRDSMSYSGLALCRGVIHYETYYLLKDLCRGMVAFGEKTLQQVYADIIGFHPRLIPNATSQKEIEKNRLKPQVALDLARVGDEEFKRFAPGGAPFELNEHFLKNLPAYLDWLSKN